MKSQLSYGLVYSEMQFAYFIKYMDHSYHQKLYILKCRFDFQVWNCQGRRVNSHPPDGVDLCQLTLLPRYYMCTMYIHMKTLNRSFQEALNSDFSVKLVLVGLP